VSAIDRAFLAALAGRRVPRLVDRFFRSVTHLGGVTATVGLALLFLAFPSTRPLGLTFSLAHLLSHGLAQILKRTVSRHRPAMHRDIPAPLIAPPDVFSFPSGHACAAMTSALVVTAAAGGLGLPLLLLARA
jgi:undecaprenyl-diphosphatase